MTFSAVITAGAPIQEPFASAAGTRFKALIKIGGTPLIERTISSLRDAGIERIAVVAGDEVAAVCAPLVHHVIPASTKGNPGAINQWLALNAWEFEAPLLYATCDMPFIHADSVRWFLENVQPRAVCMALTEVGDFRKRFPEAPPFGITLGGERVVNGGLFAIPACASHLVEALAIALFNARKSPLKMAKIAGWSILLRFVVRNLGIGDLEYRAQQLLGIPARAIRNAPPELAYDIDTLAEYEYARTHA